MESIKTTDQKKDGASWTIAKVLAAAGEFLQKHGSLSPRLEAEKLMAHTLRIDRVDLYIQFDRPLDEKERDAYREKIKARAKGIPLQYITGEQGFRKLNLKVSPAVLVPRPETELLVERVIENIKRLRQKRSGDIKILDIGTGSGAISLSLASEVDGLKIWALDNSAEALKIAEENAKNHDLEDRVVFFQSDIYSNLDQYHRGGFDAIVANPPYIAKGPMGSLPKEVCCEPVTALDGGDNGLKFYGPIIREGKPRLKKDGFMALEIGCDQASKVAAIFEDAGFKDIVVQRDYAEKDRIVTAWSERPD